MCTTKYTTTKAVLEWQQHGEMFKFNYEGSKKKTRVLLVPCPENGLCFIYLQLMSNHPPDMLSLADGGGGHNELCCDSNDPADMTWVQH